MSDVSPLLSSVVLWRRGRPPRIRVFFYYNTKTSRCEHLIPITTLRAVISDDPCDLYVFASGPFSDSPRHTIIIIIIISSCSLPSSSLTSVRPLCEYRRFHVVICPNFILQDRVHHHVTGCCHPDNVSFSDVRSRDGTASPSEAVSHMVHVWSWFVFVSMRPRPPSPLQMQYSRVPVGNHSLHIWALSSKALAKTLQTLTPSLIASCLRDFILKRRLTPPHPATVINPVHLMLPLWHGSGWIRRSIQSGLFAVIRELCTRRLFPRWHEP